MPSLNINSLFLIKDGYDKYNILVETGTYLGESINRLEPFFQKIYTIENNFHIYKVVSESNDNKDITYLYGDSDTLLCFLYTTINMDGNYKCMLYLDSYKHIYERKKLLSNELKAINKFFITECVIIIDGMRTITENKKIDITIDEIIKIVKNRVDCFYYISRGDIYNDRLIIHLNNIYI